MTQRLDCACQDYLLRGFAIFILFPPSLQVPFTYLYISYCISSDVLQLHSVSVIMHFTRESTRHFVLVGVVIENKVAFSVPFLKKTNKILYM